MKKEFVPYELALILKALGFKERVLTYYEDGKPKLHTAIEGWDFNSSFLTCVSRPTYSQAFRWFDYSTEWSGFIVPSKEEGCFEWWIQNYEDPNYLTIESDDWYRGREEAELACLIKLIELVEQKEK